MPYKAQNDEYHVEWSHEVGIDKQHRRSWQQYKILACTSMSSDIQNPRKIYLKIVK